ncbi:FecCD family ABC transporter permease [Salinicola peritrichatus]|uniref:FecCD family ABC transporter permease n=1 Tax=Salinicola peritrichatus TaxID=1267424 RepID=UPI001EF755E0|nr:iron ABC transporter permease [Salinicola peritrichatus]
MTTAPPRNLLIMRTRRRSRPAAIPVYLGLSVGLLLALIGAAVTGQVPLSLDQILKALITPFETEEGQRLAHVVFWELRLPRALMALLVGAALAMSGAALQGLFGNPLADPGIVGVSSGASLGAVAVIVLQLDTFGLWTLPLGAFVAGAATTALIYVLAVRTPQGDNASLLLIGIAINAIAGAATGYLTYLASTAQLESLLFWAMGSLGSIDWRAVAVIAPIVVLAGWLLRRQATPLDLLALGERQARHAGVDVVRLRRNLVILTALLTAAAVSFTGTIGFVGLVVPHLIRLLMGPGHRHLLPLSALAGGLLLMLADIGARSLDPPSEIPIGILTATLGGPFFLWLIARGRGMGKRA